eukprot:GHRQ01033652.1.p1 GENE.GHRQ01033652.1~~GHRQ01033652.1.p1  ORF type:complete len:109 (+),score=28.79 GHRQ01033652.1:570-896(+)
MLLLLLLLLLQPFSQQVHAQWQECSSQGAFVGMYGSQTLANLTAFRSNLLGNIWKSYDPAGEHGGKRRNIIQHNLMLRKKAAAAAAAALPRVSLCKCRQPGLRSCRHI